MTGCLFCGKPSECRLCFATLQHELCAVHSGVVMALYDLFQEQTHRWEKVDD